MLTLSSTEHLISPDAEQLVATQIRPETFSNLMTLNTIKAQRKDNTISSV